MTWPAANSTSRAVESAEPGVDAPQLPLLRGWLWLVLAATYLLGLGLTARLFLGLRDGEDLPWYVALFGLFFALLTVAWSMPQLPRPALHAIFGAQCLIILGALLIEPEYDFVVSFFVLLSYQAGLLFQTRARWIWVSAFVVLTAGSLMATLGPSKGLGLALPSMAVTVAFPALALASRSLEEARARSRAMVGDLEARRLELVKYAGEVEELAAVEERNRLARELHDSVSQAMFGIQLATRSAQIMLEKDPGAVEAEVRRLEQLTQEALARMRGLIAELRPSPARDLARGPGSVGLR